MEDTTEQRRTTDKAERATPGDAAGRPPKARQVAQMLTSSDSAAELDAEARIEPTRRPRDRDARVAGRLAMQHRTATRRRIAILCLIINTSLLVLGAVTGHPAIAATAAIGMAGGALYLNRTAR